MSTKQKLGKRKAGEVKGAKAEGPKAKKVKGEASHCDDMTWGQVGQLIKGIPPLLTFSSTTLPGQQKVAGFDIDFTVVKTKTGKKFAAGLYDTDYIVLTL